MGCHGGRVGDGHGARYGCGGIGEQDELSAILFPVFVHCYLDLVSKEHAEEAKTFLARFSPEHAAAHSADLAQLGSVTHKQHVLQNKLSSTFRTNKYNVRLSSYGFELLVRFLQEADFMLLLAIVNERINVLVAEAKPNDGVVPRFAAGALTGLSVEAMDELVEAHQVHWGTFPSFKESTHALISEFSEELKGLTDDEGRPLVFNLFTEAQAELDASFAAAAEEGAGRSKRRKRGDGSAFLSKPMVRAAERFRESYEIARAGGAIGDDLGALLEGHVRPAMPSGGGATALAIPRHMSAFQSLAKAIDKLTGWVHQWEQELPPLKEFVIPGGNVTAARLHRARTTCRKAERKTVEFCRSSGEGQQAIVFLNRLSDLLFLQARAANQADGIADVPWKPTETE